MKWVNELDFSITSHGLENTVADNWLYVSNGGVVLGTVTQWKYDLSAWDAYDFEAEQVGVTVSTVEEAKKLVEDDYATLELICTTHARERLQ